MASPKVCTSGDSSSKVRVINLVLIYCTEVANVALFLASGTRPCLIFGHSNDAYVFTFPDESSYINGQSIAVDGGLSSSLPVAPGRFA